MTALLSGLRGGRGPRNSAPGNSAPRNSAPGNSASRGGVVGGVAVVWLSLIVLAPIAAVVAAASAGGPAGFLDAVTTPSALASLRVSVICAAAVTVVNTVAGTLLAWVLVRDDFPGKTLVNTVIDLPFALPTVVASIALLALYGPGSPVGIHAQFTTWGVVLALAFVTLPFVVRSVQPVLLELDPEAEEAAASLGAGTVTTLRRVVGPALMPAILSGASLSFCRALGEYGSVVLIGGGIPRDTEVASQYVRALTEQGDRAGAAAVSVVLLVAALVVLTLLRFVGGRAARREVRDT